MKVEPTNANGNIYSEDLDVGKTKEVISKHVAGILEALGIDYKNDHNSADTPERVAKMYLDIFSGRFTAPPKITSFPNAGKYNQLIVVGPISVKSTCSHHLLPFTGEAYIGVVPRVDGNVIGLSKYARLVDWFARRPQIQEELTMQIANELERLLNPAGLAVVIKAEHFCAKVRGVEEPCMAMTTSEMRGIMRNGPLRSEFLAFIGGGIHCVSN